MYMKYLYNTLVLYYISSKLSTPNNKTLIVKPCKVREHHYYKRTYFFESHSLVKLLCKQIMFVICRFPIIVNITRRRFYFHFIVM